MSIAPLWSFEPEVRELLPVFLAQGQERLRRMDELLVAFDPLVLRHLGHGLKGSGAMYDLGAFRDLGAEIEDAARREDRRALVALRERLHQLLEELERALLRDLAA